MWLIITSMVSILIGTVFGFVAASIAIGFVLAQHGLTLKDRKVIVTDYERAGAAILPQMAAHMNEKLAPIIAGFELFRQERSGRRAFLNPPEVA